jgi:hypothetical protein
MAWLDIVAILSGSSLEVGFMEHRESCVVQSHLRQILVHYVVDLVAFQNYAHLSIYFGGLACPIKLLQVGNNLTNLFF